MGTAIHKYIYIYLVTYPQLFFIYYIHACLFVITMAHKERGSRSISRNIRQYRSLDEVLLRSSCFFYFLTKILFTLLLYA